MAEQTHILHFTLGPVQSFVEQARRTRDLWAGSFLLSYLSGQAMKAVLEFESEGANIVFPNVGTKENPSDPLLAAILGKPEKSNPDPQIGTLPNRFKAEVPGDFDPKRCEAAVRETWQHVTDKVWFKYIFHVAEHGQNTQAIWERQVSSFWDMAWVLGDSDDPKCDGAWLDRRKNWRTHQLPVEGGDHCTLMSNWQELSGYIRSRERDNQETFWEKLREKIGILDLGEHERLCAIALIKRLYPRLAKQSIDWPLEVKNWPSTPYMAAVPWVEKAQGTQAAKAYASAIKEAKIDWAFGEYNTDLSCLQSAGDFAKLDGNFFHKTALENKNATPLKTSDDSDNTELRRKLLDSLNKVNDAVDHSASSFYALLLMDGDNLGKQLQEKGGQERVSAALSKFTEQVDNIVGKHCGKTIYAGGDDVMALLPLDKALTAASELQKHYRNAFDNKEAATISGAIVFASYNLTLRSVLKEAHHQLDDVAKERNGRDSLAVSVLTGSGRTVEWVSSWYDDRGRFFVADILRDLTERFGEDKQFSSKFFYNLRERLNVLVNEKSKKFEFDLEHADFWFLKAEYERNRDGAGNAQAAEQNVHDLLKVCRQRKNGKADEQTLVPDGALLVRFLAGKGKGVER